MRLSDFELLPDCEPTAIMSMAAENIDSGGKSPAFRVDSSNDRPNHNKPAPKPDPESDEAGSVLAVLKNRNFVTLWSGQIFSQLADKVYLVLMIAIIENQFQSENQSISGWVSAIMMANTIPAVLFGSLAGVFVDRWHKKEVLVSTNILRGLLVLAAPILLWLTEGQVVANLPLGFEILIIITLLVSTLGQFFAPAEQATISRIVEKKNLLSANSLYTTTMMGSLIIGFAVGEPLLALADRLAAQIGLGVSIGKELVVGGSYALAGIILLWLKTGESKQLPQGEPPHIFADLQEGINYLSNHKTIKGALIQLVILYSAFASMTVLAVRMAEILPEIKASQFGFLLAAGGVGMALGAAMLGYLGRKFPLSQLSLFGSIGVAASLFGLSLASTSSLWLTILSIVSMGAFGSTVAIPMQTRIQSETSEDMQGKVFGLQNNAINIALSLPLALTGIAETAWGLPNVLVGVATVVIAGAVLTHRLNSAVE